jgi:hypothetical protein
LRLRRRGSGGLRLLGIRGLAAAERLQTELGELLRADAVVLLDPQAQDVRQPLALGESRAELQARLLLGGGVDALAGRRRDTPQSSTTVESARNAYPTPLTVTR